jgi:glutamate synthase (NADH) large subunit (EC 1.4.1.14)
VGFIVHIKGQKSHEIVRQGLELLKNLTHRGAVGADIYAGDGAGILIQMPDAFLRAECDKISITLPKAGDYAQAWCFYRATPPIEPLARNC